MAQAPTDDGESCDYEVKCPQTWAWYPANISDFDPKTQKFQVKYPNEFSFCIFCCLFLFCLCIVYK